MPRELDFQGRRVLVTAGTKGVGKAVVALLKQQGATVLTTARHIPEDSISETYCIEICQIHATHYYGVYHWSINVPF